jgi:hypothetical protein
MRAEEKEKVPAENSYKFIRARTLVAEAYSGTKIPKRGNIGAAKRKWISPVRMQNVSRDMGIRVLEAFPSLIPEFEFPRDEDFISKFQILRAAAANKWTMKFLFPPVL